MNVAHRYARRESVAALAACAAASIASTWRLLQPDIYSDDAPVHQYWMWHFRDPALFTDPLTAELRDSARYPPGYEGLSWLATQVFDPVAFGEWLGVALMALSGWLIFLIVREHTGWRPAAWIAGAVFLALIDIHRFHGGFPRAFVHPVVLATVLLSIRRHHVAAALTAAAGALLYPPAALLAVGVLLLSAVRWDGWRPAPDGRRAALAALALGLAAALVLIPSWLAGGAPRVMSASEARAFGEFGPHGQLHFFVPSVLEYLRQNRSGFDLRATGSALALAALVLVALRPSGLRLLRREVLAVPVAALCGYAAAQLVLFHLYLPHRFTYPLVAFFAIWIGVAIRPAWESLVGRSRARAAVFVLAPVAVAVLAVCAFPLGPTAPLARALSAPAVAVAILAAVAAVAVAVRAPGASAGAAVTGAVLIAALLTLPHYGAGGSRCPSGPSISYLGSVPKDAVIAGDPFDLRCLPVTARRAVVTSTQLAPSYETVYFHHGRERMFAMLRALYGPSLSALADLRTRYGATHLWVRSALIRRELAGRGLRWRRGRLPYGAYVRALVATGETPAVLRLGSRCRLWERDFTAVYDIACITRSHSSP